MKATIGTKIGSGFAAALLIFVVVGIVSYQSIQRLTESAKMVTFTHSVIQHLDDVLISLGNAQRAERGYVITGQEQYLDPYLATAKSIEKDVGEARSLLQKNPVMLQKFERVAPLIDAEMQEFKEVIEIAKTKGTADAAASIKTGKAKKTMDDIQRQLREIIQDEENLLKTREEEEHAMTNSAQMTIVSGILFAVVIVSLAGFMITRNIAKPLGEVTNVAGMISVGDLSVSIAQVDRGDEVGTLMRSFHSMVVYLRGMSEAARKIAANDLTATVTPQSDRDTLGKAFASMVDNLRKTMQELRDAINVIASSSAQIMSMTAELATSSKETAAAVSETTATMEEVKQTVKVVNQKANVVSDAAQNAVRASEAGGKSVEQTVVGMGQIKEQMNMIADSIIKLSTQSQMIGEIISSVNDLASQSNLLAVNASIEAAKAGEHGKGFAVVAQEVRNLAEQSKEATNQVKSILNDIQKAISGAVMATEQGGKAVETGVRQTTSAGEAINVMASIVDNSAEVSIQIVASTNEQVIGIEQVALAMDNIKLATEQVVGSIRQAQAGTQNLHDVGQKLKQLVDMYRL